MGSHGSPIGGVVLLIGIGNNVKVVAHGLKQLRGRLGLLRKGGSPLGAYHIVRLNGLGSFAITGNKGRMDDGLKALWRKALTNVVVFTPPRPRRLEQWSEWDTGLQG